MNQKIKNLLICLFFHREITTNNLFNIPSTIVEETESDQQESTSSKTIREKLKFVYKWIVKTIKEKEKRIIFYFWRLCEIHVYKFILITIACLCLTKINIFNALIFSILIFSLLLDRIHSIEHQTQAFFSHIIQLLVCFLTILSMIYQLSFINNTFFVTTCNSSNNETIDPYLKEPRDNLEYIGLKKDSNIGSYLQVHSIFLFYKL